MTPTVGNARLHAHMRRQRAARSAGVWTEADAARVVRRATTVPFRIAAVLLMSLAAAIALGWL